MDEHSMNVIVLGETTVELEGRGFVLKPLLLHDIILEYAARCGILFPRGTSDEGYGCLYNLLTPERRNSIDALFKKCVTYDGSPMTLAVSAEIDLTTESINSLLSTILHISGLGIGKGKMAGTETTTAEEKLENWMRFAAIFADRLKWELDDVMGSPILRLQSLLKALQDIPNETAIGIAQAFGGSREEGERAKADTSGEYEELKFKIPSTGEMKTPDEMTREEYLEWVSSST